MITNKITMLMLNNADANNKNSDLRIMMGE